MKKKIKAGKIFSSSTRSPKVEVPKSVASKKKPMQSNYDHNINLIDTDTLMEEINKNASNYKYKKFIESYISKLKLNYFKFKISSAFNNIDQLTMYVEHFRNTFYSNNLKIRNLRNIIHYDTYEPEPIYITEVNEKITLPDFYIKTIQTIYKNKLQIKGGAQIHDRLNSMGKLDQLNNYCINTNSFDSIRIQSYIEGINPDLLNNYPDLKLYIDTNKNLHDENKEFKYKYSYEFTNCHKYTDGYRFPLKYSYCDFNKDIVEAYQKNYLQDKNIKAINNLIDRQLDYIDSLTREKKIIIQDYTKEFAFKFYIDYKKGDGSYIHNEKLFEDSFYPQIHKCYPELFNLTLFLSPGFNKTDYNSGSHNCKTPYEYWLNKMERIKIHTFGDTSPLRISIFKDVLTDAEWEFVLNQFMNDLTEIILYAPPVEEVIHFYRGVTMHYIRKGSEAHNFDIIPGKKSRVFKSDRISSFTLDLDVSLRFMQGGSNNTNGIYRTTVIPGCKILFVGSLSVFPEELEFISPIDTLFIYDAAEDSVDNYLMVNKAHNNIREPYSVCSATDPFNSLDVIVVATPQPREVLFAAALAAAAAESAATVAPSEPAELALPAAAAHATPAELTESAAFVAPSAPVADFIVAPPATPAALAAPAAPAAIAAPAAPAAPTAIAPIASPIPVPTVKTIMIEIPESIKFIKSILSNPLHETPITLDTSILVSSLSSVPISSLSVPASSLESSKSKSKSTSKSTSKSLKMSIVSANIATSIPQSSVPTLSSVPTSSSSFDSDKLFKYIMTDIDNMNNINIIKEKYNKFIVEGDRIIFNKIIYNPRVIQSVKLFKPITSYEFAIAPLEIVPDDKHQLPIDIKNIIFMNGAYISKDRLNYFISKAFSEERQRNERSKQNERIREETMVKTLKFTENISIETYLGKALDLLCCCQKRS
jgi:hypothetical protein